jgi:anti-sigma B factor antagonist
MELQIEPLSPTVTKAVAIGRWDIVGAAAIDLKLSALAGSGRSVIIDLTQVSFLSSMGIRAIVMSAKAVALRQAKLVLLSPDKNVETVLTSTGIDTLVPICHGIDAALAEIGVGQTDTGA